MSTMMELVPDPPIILEKTPSIKSNRSGNKRRKARRASQKIDPNAPIELQKQQLLTLLGQHQRGTAEFKSHLQVLGQDAIHAWMSLALNYMAVCIQLMYAERSQCQHACKCQCHQEDEQLCQTTTPSPRSVDVEQQQHLRTKVLKSPGSTGTGSVYRDSGIEESVYLDDSMSPAPRTDSEYYRSEDDTTTTSIKSWCKTPLKPVAPVTHLVQKPVHVLSSSEEDDENTCEESEPLPKTIFKPTNKANVVAQADTVVSKSLLRGHVVETKYVTTVFESLSMKDLVDDVQEELRLWVLNDNNSIAVAAEMIWSYPQVHRSKQHEITLKDRILAALRHNNRRVLNLHAACNYMSAKGGRSPLLTFPDSIVRELCGPADSYCHQGHYAREYRSLLPQGHHEAKLMHEPFWSPGTSSLPDPAQYLMGRKRRSDELRTQFLVALNFALIKLDSAKKFQIETDEVYV